MRLSVLNTVRPILKVFDRVNTSVDRYIAPSSKSHWATYRNVLDGVTFDRGLHLGAGRDRKELGVELQRNGEVIALDVDHGGLLANKTSEKVRGDGQRLPFAEDVFDLVFCEYVFEHLAYPDATLAEIDRVVRPGASVVIFVPNPRHYYARIADHTPLWFHRFWTSLRNGDRTDSDYFPTRYEWGRLEDIRDVPPAWSIERFESFPGPTSYTRILPIHILFALYDRAMAEQPKYHVAYIAHYRIQ